MPFPFGRPHPIFKRLLDGTPPVGAQTDNVSGCVMVFVKLACVYDLMGPHLHMPLQRNASI